MKLRRSLFLTFLLASTAPVVAKEPDHADEKEINVAADAAHDNAGSADADAEPEAVPASTPPAPFAARLAEMPLQQALASEPLDKAWQVVARSDSASRQQARWNLARALAQHGRAAQSLGVLGVMQADDPDLELVAAWRFAYGAALGDLGRTNAALSAFNDPGLRTMGTACAWRLRLNADKGEWQDAASEFRCAAPAMDAMDSLTKRPFVLAAARTAIGLGEPDKALTLLSRLDDGDALANLLRGAAMIASGQREEGSLRLRRVTLSGTQPERAAAQLELIEAGIADKSLSDAQAAKRLDTLLFRWRGDDTERRALDLRWKIAEAMNDDRAALQAGATLFRHFDLGRQTRPVLERLQAMLASLLDDRKLALSQAAGIYWEYRDLAPTGAEGDAMAFHLADRLTEARLFARAAELLRYQMDYRAKDIAKGPISVRVAELELLADRPEAALEAMEASDSPSYPADMLADRRRMSAIALFRVGRTSEAMTMIDLVPNSAALKAEMLWHKRDWVRFAGVNGSTLPGPGKVDPVAETALLRQAVALAMQGDEAGLAKLRRTYGKAMNGRPGGKALEMLTARPDQIDPGSIEAALAAMPGAPAAGALSSLLG